MNLNNAISWALLIANWFCISEWLTAHPVRADVVWPILGMACLGTSRALRLLEKGKP